MPDSDPTAKSLRCYRCGSSLEALSPPLGRRDLCPQCGVELHVCRMCLNFSPGAPDSCLEEDAVVVRVKTTANFCDYFAPSPDAYDGADKRAEEVARGQLDALFDGKRASDSPKSGPKDDSPALQQAEDLFKK